MQHAAAFDQAEAPPQRGGFQNVALAETDIHASVRRLARGIGETGAGEIDGGDAFQHKRARQMQRVLPGAAARRQHGGLFRHAIQIGVGKAVFEPGAWRYRRFHRWMSVPARPRRFALVRCRDRRQHRQCGGDGVFFRRFVALLPQQRRQDVAGSMRVQPRHRMQRHITSQRRQRRIRQGFACFGAGAQGGGLRGFRLALPPGIAIEKALLCQRCGESRIAAAFQQRAPRLRQCLFQTGIRDRRRRERRVQQGIVRDAAACGGARLHQPGRRRGQRRQRSPFLRDGARQQRAQHRIVLREAQRPGDVGEEAARLGSFLRRQRLHRALQRRVAIAARQRQRRRLGEVACRRLVLPQPVCRQPQPVQLVAIRHQGSGGTGACPRGLALSALMIATSRAR